MSEWISVKEKLPENNMTCLCCLSIYGHSIIRILNYATSLCKVDEYDFYGMKQGGFYEYDTEWGYKFIDHVTHWLPLPEPPEGE